MNYEELQIQNADLNMKEMDLSEVSGLKGLYYNGNIAIEKKLTQNQKACVLAEELGHHYTTVGNILDQSDPGAMKQERKARLWAYNKLIGLSVSSRDIKHTAGTGTIWQNIWMSQRNSWMKPSPAIATSTEHPWSWTDI